MTADHDDGEGHGADGDGHVTLESMGFRMTAKICEKAVARLARNVPTFYGIQCSNTVLNRLQPIQSFAVEVVRCVPHITRMLQ